MIIAPFGSKKIASILMSTHGTTPGFMPGVFCYGAPEMIGSKVTDKVERLRIVRGVFKPPAGASV